MRTYTLICLLLIGHYSFPQSEYVPENLNDGWEIDSAAVNSSLTSLSNSLDITYKKIDGILVIKDGKLIFEKYYNGYSPFILHDTRSATKSITSLLIGKAIDLNYLKSEDEYIASYFSQYKLKSPSVRIKNILMMRSGLDCDDWDINSEGNEQKMSQSSDWYKYIVELEKVAEPGEKFGYCTGSYNLLGRVLEESTNTSIEFFSRNQLFAPLKIGDYNWYTNTHNFKPYMGGSLFLNLRDFAKFGQVILNEGKWHEEQVLSKQWIDKIWNNGKAIEPEGSNLQYSYGWWLKKIKYKGKSYHLATASGNGGQKIIVVKELDLVLAMFGNGYGEPYFEEEQPTKILKNHLLMIQ